MTNAQLLLILTLLLAPQYLEPLEVDKIEWTDPAYFHQN